jgi:uncharacterized protein
MRKLLILATALILLTSCGRKSDIIPPGTILPQAPTAFVVEPHGDSILLAFNAPAKDTNDDPLTDLAGYAVMRAELPEDKNECPCLFQKVAYIDLEAPGAAVITGKRVAWPDKSSALVPGRKYMYKVAAVNSGGYPGVESDQAAARLLVPPAVPANLRAAVASHTAKLSWDEARLDVSGKPVDDLAGYNLYRAKKPDEKPERAVNARPLTGTSYADTGLVNGETYYYRLSALRGKEAPLTEGGQTAPVMAKPVDVEPPARPAGLRAVPGEGGVLLSWEPDVEPDLAGYRLYRQAAGEPKPVLVNEKLIEGITFKDTGASTGKTYTYTVTAVDDAVPPNESLPSEPATLNVP